MQRGEGEEGKKESERLNKWGKCYLDLGEDAMNDPLIELRFAMRLQKGVD